MIGNKYIYLLIVVFLNDLYNYHLVATATK